MMRPLELLDILSLKMHTAPVTPVCAMSSQIQELQYHYRYPDVKLAPREVHIPSGRTLRS